MCGREVRRERGEERERAERAVVPLSSLFQTPSTGTYVCCLVEDPAGVGQEEGVEGAMVLRLVVEKLRLACARRPAATALEQIFGLNVNEEVNDKTNARVHVVLQLALFQP